jgi:hypothetical protein
MAARTIATTVSILHIGYELLCLTNESDGAIRTRKVRAMLIRSEDLKNLPEEMPELESQNHVTRWKTLQFMAKRLEEKPFQFFKVELVV